MVDEQEKRYTVTPCMDVYKTNIQYDGNVDKLKLRTAVREDFQNKDLIGDTWSPTDSMRNLKYFILYSIKYKARVRLLVCIVSFLHSKVKNRVFVKLDSRYAD